METVRRASLKEVLEANDKLRFVGTIETNRAEQVDQILLILDAGHQGASIEIETEADSSGASRVVLGQISQELVQRGIALQANILFFKESPEKATIVFMKEPIPTLTYK